MALNKCRLYYRCTGLRNVALLWNIFHCIKEIMQKKKNPEIPNGGKKNVFPFCFLNPLLLLEMNTLQVNSEVV